MARNYSDVNDLPSNTRDAIRFASDARNSKPRKRIPVKPRRRKKEIEVPNARINTWVFDVTRHDAYIEITSPETGHTALLRTERQPEDSSYWPGERLAWLFIGNDPNNPRHWRSFGSIDDFGIKVHNTCMNKDGSRSIWEKYAGMLERAAWFETARGCRYKFTLIQD